MKSLARLAAVALACLCVAPPARAQSVDPVYVVTLEADPSLQPYVSTLIFGKSEATGALVFQATTSGNYPPGSGVQPFFLQGEVNWVTLFISQNKGSFSPRKRVVLRIAN